MVSIISTKVQMKEKMEDEAAGKEWKRKKPGEDPKNTQGPVFGNHQ